MHHGHPCKAKAAAGAQVNTLKSSSWDRWGGFATPPPTSFPLINSQSERTDVTESRQHLKIKSRFFSPSFQENNAKSPDVGEQFTHMMWKVPADTRQTGQVFTVTSFLTSTLTSDEPRWFHVNLRRYTVDVSLSERWKEKLHQLRRSRRPHLLRG